MKGGLKMGIKSKKNYINAECEKHYPGMKDYYLHCVKDEIVDTIRKETLEDTYFLSTDDIQKMYGIDKSELMHVITLLDEEPTLKRKNFIRNRNAIEYKVYQNEEMYMISERIDKEFQETLYDQKQHAISVFGRTDLPYLVFSLKQARKMVGDLFSMMLKIDNKRKQRNVLEEYIKNIKGLSIEEKQENGNSVVALKQNGEILLEGTYEELIRIVGTGTNDTRISFSPKDYAEALKSIYEKTQKQQIEGIVEERKDRYLGIRNIDESQMNADWFDEEIQTIEIWNGRKHEDPSLKKRTSLNDEDIRWVTKEADRNLAIAYKQNLDKVKVR